MVKQHRKRAPGSETDTDFQDNTEESEEDVPEEDGEDAAKELGENQDRQLSIKHGVLNGERNFKRAEMPLLTPRSALPPNGRDRSNSVGSDDGQYYPCIACNEKHDTGFCPLKLAGVEYCNLCGLPHYGIARTCPHLNSVTQLRAMVEALKQSSEPQELKEAAKKRVVGIIGDLNQRKRKKQEAQSAQRVARPLQQVPPTGPFLQHEGRMWDSQGRLTTPFAGVAQLPNGQENHSATAKQLISNLSDAPKV